MKKLIISDEYITGPDMRKIDPYYGVPCDWRNRLAMGVAAGIGIIFAMLLIEWLAGGRP